MKTKNIIILASVAAVLGGAAYFTSAGRKISSPKLIGKKIVSQFKITDVAKIEISGKDKLVIASSDAGWTVDRLYGYPADITKIRENVLKLADLKVGQITGKRKADTIKTEVSLKDAAGQTLAALTLLDTHYAKSRGSMGGYGGGADGRYVAFEDSTVLVKDALEAFDGDAKKWVDTRICSVDSSDATSVTFASGNESFKLVKSGSDWKADGLKPDEELDASKLYSVGSALSYLNMTGIADPAKESEYGFDKGATYTLVTAKGITYVAKIGNKQGEDRLLRLSASFKPVGTNVTENVTCEKTVKDFNAKNEKWIYTVSAYSADSMCKTRKDLVKVKDPPKKDEKSADDKAKASK